MNAVSEKRLFTDTTFVTFHIDIALSPVNARAPSNALFIYITFATSHAPIGMLNAIAPENIASMLRTEPTFHAEMFALNKYLSLNRNDMSVMADTSHVPIAGEHKPTGESARHASTASPRSVLVKYTGTAYVMQIFSNIEHRHGILYNIMQYSDFHLHTQKKTCQQT